MAGTFSRIADIFRSKTNKALDKMEDPATRSTSPTRSRSSS